MTAPAKTRRGWRYYAVRTGATLFVIGGTAALNVLFGEIPGDLLGLLVRGLLGFLVTVAAIWTTATIWGSEWPAPRRSADD
jgi:hypothetical protein